jgi:DNA-binding transcriptional LysR family regulator
MIDPVTLRSLVAVGREGTVGAAAQSLGYTPSAVSQQIKRLESQSGVPLLEKHGRGVMLTEAGRVLLSSAQGLLAQMEQLESQLRATDGRPSGSVRLASFATAQRGIAAPAMRRLAAAYPALTVTLQEAEPWPAIDLVASGQVDLAVVHNWEPLPLTIPDHVDSRLLGTDVADVLLHRDHPLAARRSLTARAVADERWVSVAPGSICHQWLAKMLGDLGRTPRIAHYAQEFETHIALVREGLGIALVPRLGRGRLPEEVVAVRLAQPVPHRVVSVVWRRTMAASPALAAVTEELAQAANGLRH